MKKSKMTKMSNFDTKQLSIGSFTHNKLNNELGVVGEMRFSGARCWTNNGIAKSVVPYGPIERISYEDVLKRTFSNEQHKASLIERHYRIHEGGNVTSVIYDKDIRPSIKIQLRLQEDKNNVRE